MKKNRVGSKFDCKQIFHPTFSGSSNKNFNIGLVYSLFHSIFHSHDVILNVRTSNFEWFNKTKTLCKIIAIKKNHTCQIEISLNNSKEDFDHLSNLQEQNGEEYEDGERKLKQRKKKKQADQRKYTKETEKKEKLRKIIRSRILPRSGFSSSEFTSSDSITGESISIVSFDLILTERMNGLACWIKHIGWHVQTIYTFTQHSSNIYPKFYPTC